MNTIDYILENFYNCINLPIRTIDNKFNILKSFGYNQELDNIYHHSNIVLNLDSTSDNLYKIKYLDLEDIYYSIKHISFRSLDCLAYLKNLLRSIHEDKFSKGRINKGYNLYVRKTIEFCIANYSNEVSIDCVCNNLNINKCYFCKLFKAETGYTFSTFLNILRIEKNN